MKDDYISTLYQVSKSFHALDDNIDEVLIKGLEVLLESLGFDRAAIFLYDGTNKKLRPTEIVTVRGVMDGEGEILLDANKNDPFSLIVFGKQKLIIKGAPEYSIYLTLVNRKKRLLGFLRADNIFKERKVTTEQMRGLKDFAEIFSIAFDESDMHLQYRAWIKRLSVLNRLSTAINSSLQLEKVLELILSSLVTDLGFDRAKLYLVDNEKENLKEVMEFDNWHKLRICEKELYPLKRGVASVVDIFMSDSNYIFCKESMFYNLMVGIPIYVRNEKIGFLVVDNILTRQEIKPEDIEILNTFANQSAVALQNAQLYAKVEELSIVDELTQVYNRRFFQQKIKEEIGLAKRYNSTLSLSIIDIDFFKNYNDKNGHPAGDECLKQVAKIILQSTRKTDIVARYGGEEFALIMPATDKNGAGELVDKLRHSIENFPFEFRHNQPGGKLTVSAGIAAYPQDSKKTGELIDFADQSLYQAKARGRNKITIHS